ncbi:hypothetical protein AXG93_4735s1070 [Marchantia polymorpha subsp. ruderalis]|uniref:GRPD C-terminal domain-containing protein n=1 Tax=Marchantia polymorpha subsp. ruderalis TaxID=1480154 RepID=A0A176WPZ4_MARPO|nr:hypothetical protein AXG93_4735s1070 [Marchantia polymorpha subsp. ruderalis]
MTTEAGLHINKLALSTTNTVDFYDGQTAWNTAQSAAWFHIDIDLIAAAKRQLRFLEVVDQTAALQQNELLRCAVFRYWNYWLPLASKFQACGFPSNDHQTSIDCLLAPLDCAWIWHCHKLNPVRYGKDCIMHFGEVIDIRTVPGGDSTEADLQQASSEFWQTEYPGEPYHLILPFEDGLSDEFQKVLEIQCAKLRPLSPPMLSYDLVAAADRQRHFFYQVQRSWFKDDEFLQEAVQRYRAYLYMMQQALQSRKEDDPQVFLVPTFDIDLIWHTHMLHPSTYARETTNLMKRVLDHDDTDTDRGAGKKLNTGFIDSCNRWWTTFGTVYERAGAMYRGPDPPMRRAPAKHTKDGWAMGRERTILEFTEKGKWNSSHYDSLMTSDAEQTPAVDARSTCQVHVVILSAKNLPKPLVHQKDTFQVRVTALQRCPFLSVHTENKKAYGENQVEWNHGIAMEAEQGTIGLQFELLRTSKLRKKAGCSSRGLSKISEFVASTNTTKQNKITSLGTVNIYWVEVDFHESRRISKSLDTANAVMQFCISVTKFRPAPRLFRTLHSPVTEDNHRMVALHIGNSIVPQQGRWTTKTVVNHKGTPIYKIQQRLDETFTGQDLATCRLLSTEYHKKNKNIREWNLFNDGAILTVYKPSTTTNDVPCDLYGLLGRNRMRLLSGRRMEYAVANDRSKEKFLTLMRYTPEAPTGTATALLNLTKACFEVQPEESTVLVLLISAAVTMSLHEFGTPVNKSANWSVDKSYKRRRLGGASDGELGAVKLKKNEFSPQWTQTDPSDEDPENKSRSLYIPWNQSDVHIFYGQDLASAQCESAACAGTACGGN